MAVPISRDTVVSLEIDMYDAQGVRLHAPAGPTIYLHGGYGGLLPALEEALEGKKQGDQVSVQLEPEEAFGDYEADLLRLEAVSRYGDGLKVGMQVEEGGNFYTVTDIAAGKAVLDANHPLAGIALRFEIKVLEARPASAEEIARGVSLP